MDQKDPQSLDNASRDFLDVLQSDQRLSQARERERDQQRKRGGQASLAEPGTRSETKPRTAISGAPAQSRPSEPAAPAGPLVAHQPVADAAAAPAAEAGDAQPPLIAGQRVARPAADASARLPTGVAQQPPSAGLARPPAQAQVQPQALVPPGAGPQGASPQGAGPLALVDARTLAALASTFAAPPPAGRLVGPTNAAGPMSPAPLAGLGGGADKASLVGPAARPGVAAGQRPAPAATLSAVTPAEVRERIQTWMLTGVLNTAPVRFPAIDPLSPGESPAARQGVTRATAVSSLARGVSTKPSSAPPVPLPAANDAPGPASPLAANDGRPALGLAVQQDPARRGGTAVPLDFARAARAAQAGPGGDPRAPTRLDIPGLRPPRV